MNKTTMDFEDASDLVYVDPAQNSVSCRGVSKNLGHPEVYLTFDGSSSVRCYYCGREFKKHAID